MKWLVQEFINNNTNYLRMTNALESLGIDYLIVSIQPNKELKVVDQQTKCIIAHSESMITEFTADSNVMVYGSKTFALMAEEMNLKPGSFMTNNFEFENMKVQFGSELLNAEFMVGDLFSLQPKWNSFFIRPTGNTKLFTGMEVSLSEFEEWKERESQKKSLYRGAKLMIAPIKEIFAEYRFFIVDGKVITGSSYKANNTAKTSLAPSAKMIDYAQKMADFYPVARAYVMDIAETVDGFKIVECNNINSSGLYDCDEFKLIKAVNGMVF